MTKTYCDLCGRLRPEKYSEYTGWVTVFVTGGKNQEICNICWKPVDRILSRSFVDGLLLEAQGIKEET